MRRARQTAWCTGFGRAPSKPSDQLAKQLATKRRHGLRQPSGVEAFVFGTNLAAPSCINTKRKACPTRRRLPLPAPPHPLVPVDIVIKPGREVRPVRDRSTQQQMFQPLQGPPVDHLPAAAGERVVVGVEMKIDVRNIFAHDFDLAMRNCTLFSTRRAGSQSFSARVPKRGSGGTLNPGG